MANKFNKKLNETVISGPLKSFNVQNIERKQSLFQEHVKLLSTESQQEEDSQAGDYRANMTIS